MSADVLPFTNPRERMLDERDLRLIAEVETGIAKLVVEVARDGGVSFAYLDALLRAAWSLPPRAAPDDG